MWTHLHPYIETSFTREDIEHRARISLYRAINLRRLVAFTGSGTTMSFGMPSWPGLGAEFVSATDTQLRKVHDAGGQGLWTLENRRPQLLLLRRMIGLGEGGGEWYSLYPIKGQRIEVDNPAIVIELCEAILTGLPLDDETGRSRLWLARKDFAAGFRAGTDAMAARKLRHLFPDSPFGQAEQGSLSFGPAGYADALKRIVQGETPERVVRGCLVTPKDLDAEAVAAVEAWRKSLAEDNTGDADLAANLLDRLYQKIARKKEEEEVRQGDQPEPESPHGVDRPLSAGTLPEPDTDVVNALVNTVGIDRFLTMNYDVQLERAFLKRARRRGAEPGITPFEHLCIEKPTDRDDPRTVTIEDGLRRAARSATLAPGEVGAMISFAAFARTYERQVFHLHGRLDDPTNIVLTQKDYRRVYLADDDAEQAFFEAQEVTFGGNDFLFVGVGMSEADVLRPFRRFVSRGVAPDQSPRGIFCLMPCHHDDKMQAQAEQKAIDWIVQYDAYTIFFGDEAYRKSMKSLDSIAASLEPGGDRHAKYQAFREAMQVLDEKDRVFFEGWLGPAFCHLRKDEHRRVAAHALIEEISSRLRARALVSELESLRDKSERWWKAFRTMPRERKSIYSQLVNDPNFGTMTVRHRVTGHSEMRKPQNDQPNWTITKELAGSEIQQTIERKGRMRIMRIALPRGGGKGSLVQILMHKDHRRLVFGPMLEGRDYDDAFIAHLSFSMEFNSVLRAFSRFIAARIAECQVRAVRRAPLDRPLPDSDIVGILRVDLKQEGLFEKAEELTNKEKDEREAARKAACDAFVKTRRDEPEMVLEPLNTVTRDMLYQPRGDGSQKVRRHRLDTLQELLDAYARIAHGDERVFVCLSNLDRICDADGDGHNPVHRAFFRLITASADTRHSQPKPPIDLLLIAGNPEVPIRYLSREIPKLEDVPLADQSLFSTTSKSAAVLERWPQIKTATWRDRVYLTPFAAEDSLPDPGVLDALLDGGMIAFEDDLERYTEGDQTQRAEKEHYDNRPFRRVALLTAALEKATTRTATGGVGLRGVYRQITSVLLGNAAMTGLVMTLWARMPDQEDHESEVGGCAEFLRRLDAAAARYPEAVYEFVLSEYRKIDIHDGWKTLDTPPPDHAEFNAGMFALVLRHLCLFSLPIEPWVLLGCPILLSEMRSLLQKSDEEEKGGENTKDAATAARQEWTRRHKRLNILRIHIEELVRRGLVIEVAATFEGEDAQEGTAPNEPNAKERQDRKDELFIHKRFSLHARLREHLARQMRLSVVDEGDSNHHQLSIYCDQPRDLPTPSRDHFAMIRDILDLQIARCRETLKLFYTLRPHREKAAGVSAGSTEELNELYGRAARILFSPRDRIDDSNLAGHLGELHAITQRLRGCYSLMRGAFSLGAISRLRADTLSDGGQLPFESYQGWLRSLCNAAIGLEWNNRAIYTVLEGKAFQDDAGGDLPSETDEIKALTEIAEKNFMGLFDNHGTDMPGFEEHITEVRKGIYRRADEMGLAERQKVLPVLRRVRHPLYRDEIAWVFNERGLAALVQGRIFDAVPLFGLARRIVEHSSSRHEEPHYHHAAEHRIMLNLAITQIERGRIASARRDLETIERQTESHGKWTPNPLHLFAKGYLALCDHLSGSLQRAEGGYRDVVEEFVAMKRLRPVSIFNRYMADLLRSQGDLDGALRHANLAMTAAGQAEQRDIQHYAINASARVLAHMGERNKAMIQADRVIGYAGQMGLYGLQTEGELTRCGLMVDSGDTQLGGAAAARAIALSTRYGMRLRRLRALSLYSKIQIKLGRTDIARTVLDEAKSEAERVGYQTQAARISEILANLP